MVPYARRFPLACLIGSLSVLALAVACSAPASTPTPAVTPQAMENTALTASYRMVLKIGPPAMAVPGMTLVDRDQPVNHHFAVHIFDKSSGARVTDVHPTVTIVGQAAGTPRFISDKQESVFTLACLKTRHLDPNLHFGDNIFLPDGQYTFNVAVDTEVARFGGVVV